MQREAILRAKRVGSCELKTGASRGGPFPISGKTFWRQRAGEDQNQEASLRARKSRAPSLSLSLSLTDFKRPAGSAHFGEIRGWGRQKTRARPLRKQRERPPAPAPPFPPAGAPQTPSDAPLCSLFLGPGGSAPRAADGQGKLGCSLCSFLICIFNYSSKI